MPSKIGLIVWGMVMVTVCLVAIEIVRTQS
jgi:hypothetical protein